MRSAASTRAAGTRAAVAARANTFDRVALKRVTEETMTLPTFPIVASRLIEEVARPNATSEEIARIVSLDPALTARTLKLANSDFYGFPRKVGSVADQGPVRGASASPRACATRSAGGSTGSRRPAMISWRRRVINSPYTAMTQGIALFDHDAVAWKVKGVVDD